MVPPSSEGPPSAPPPRRNGGVSYELELAEFIAADDKKRAELTFKLLLALAREAELAGQRLDRHGRRLYALERAAEKSPSYHPPKGETEQTGRYELSELRDEKKWWKRLAVTFVVGVISALTIAGLLSFARLVWTLAKGAPQ
jgi:hypothetical protein